MAQNSVWTATQLGLAHNTTGCVRLIPECHHREGKELPPLRVVEFSLLGQSEDPLDTKNRYLDLNSLQAREESAIRLGLIHFKKSSEGTPKQRILLSAPELMARPASRLEPFE
ncbi:hypothetical protein CFP56_038623 [Quercus suber]|uniref:Uncharacterized protein n=1 Tax=Quercus suber TaxID=58331 RepID=A0AAW0LNT1_QUESU